MFKKILLTTFIIFTIFIFLASVLNLIPKKVLSQPISEIVGIGALPTINFYAIKRTNIAGVSQNLSFGFMAKRVSIEAAATNTDEIVVDWLGGTAVVPVANTAGDDRIPAGRILTFDFVSVSSISVIAASGTQTVYVRAFN